MDLVRGRSSFEFEVDQPLDVCVAGLENIGQTGFARLSTKVHLAWNDEGFYRFNVRHQEGRDFPVIVSGWLQPISEESTCVTGTVLLSGNLFALVVIASCGLVWSAGIMPTFPFPMILAAGLMVFAVFDSAKHRHIFVDLFQDELCRAIPGRSHQEKAIGSPQ